MRFATLAARPAPVDGAGPSVLLLGPLRVADLGDDPEAVAAELDRLRRATGGRAALVLELPAGPAAEELVDAALRLAAVAGRPAPALWLACRDEVAVRRAGALGLGALVLTAPGADVLAAWVRAHRAALAGEGCVPLGLAVTTAFGVVADRAAPSVAALRAAGVDVVVLADGNEVDAGERAAVVAGADADDAAREAALAEAVEAALARRAPLRVPAASPAVAPAPVLPVSVPPVSVAPISAPPSAGRRGRPRLRRLRRRALDGVEAAFAAHVRGADDARLERTVVSPLGLRVLFRAMERRFAPERAEGIRGELGFELRGRAGDVRAWTLVVGADGAHARPGRATEPRLVVRCTRGDLARLAAREIDAGDALLDGRLDVEGDFALAARLGRLLGASG